MSYGDWTGVDEEQTKRTPLAKALAEELTEVRASLESSPGSPKSRELLVRVAKYEHVLSSCRGPKEDGPQQRALCELVCELRLQAEALCDAAPVPELTGANDSRPQ